LRFYDLQGGRILVDDTDIARLDPRALRRQIGLVPQDTVLFGESALENIRYGRPEATDGEVREAARLARPTTSSARCRKLTPPSSASAARDCPAASASASPSPARS
jgi:ABC-type Fe3+/spermidine/putrescine transport system ATPase subunit